MFKLSIIIPVFNEKNTIGQVLESLTSVKLPIEREIIIIDDGSTDGTSKEVLSFLNVKKLGEKIIYTRHKKNKGKGAAIKTGVKAASGDYILIQDADFEYNPLEINRLLKPVLIQKQNANNIAVYGSRFKNKNVVIPFLYLLGNKLLTFITNILYGTKLTDMETGYKLLPASFLKKIKLSSSHFDIEPEITVKLIKNKTQIVEVPISYIGRSHLAGKKLTVVDAFEAIRTLFYFRFLHR